MYKYVQRRLRDIVERTNNILDVKGTWTCSKTKHQAGQVVRKGPSGLVCVEARDSVRPSFSSFQSSSGNEECHKERPTYNHDHLSWLSALTWSSALVCGWYASQLLCLHRRNVGWDTRCYYSKLLLQPSRAFHSRVARVVLATSTPYARSTGNEVPQQRQRKFLHVNNEVEAASEEDSGVDLPKSYEAPAFEDREELHDLHKFVVNVQDEGEVVTRPKEKSRPTIETAAKDLLSVLADIEFELGVKSLSLGDFETAVSHLKLATSHHHAGATFNLGVCFEEGLGVKQNLKMAMECYQAASQLGHPKAIYNLGVFYALGLGGLRKNRVAAKRCFVTAAQMGLHEAKAALGFPTLSQEIRTEATLGASMKPVNMVLVS